MDRRDKEVQSADRVGTYCEAAVSLGGTGAADGSCTKEKGQEVAGHGERIRADGWHLVPGCAEKALQVPVDRKGSERGIIGHRGVPSPFWLKAMGAGRRGGPGRADPLPLSRPLIGSACGLREVT